MEYFSKVLPKYKLEHFSDYRNGNDIKKDLFYCHDKLVPVTTPWRVLMLQIEKRPPIWRVAANVLNNQSRQQKRGGPGAWGSGELLTTPHCKFWPCYLTDTCNSDLDWFFGRISAHLEESGVDGRIKLRQIFRKWDGAELNWYGSWQGQVADTCKPGIGPYSAIKCGEFLG